MLQEMENAGLSDLHIGLDPADADADADAVSVDDIYGISCDLFCPCGLGAVLNPETISRLKCNMVLRDHLSAVLTPDTEEPS